MILMSGLGVKRSIEVWGEGYIYIYMNSVLSLCMSTGCVSVENGELDTTSFLREPYSPLRVYTKHPRLHN